MFWPMQWYDTLTFEYKKYLSIANRALIQLLSEWELQKV